MNETITETENRCIIKLVRWIFVAFRTFESESERNALVILESSCVNRSAAQLITIIDKIQPGYSDEKLLRGSFSMTESHEQFPISKREALCFESDKIEHVSWSRALNRASISASNSHFPASVKVISFFFSQSPALPIFLSLPLLWRF